MKIKIDTIKDASYINQVEYSDTRRYYELPDGTLIVCRNNLTLEQCRGQVVDANKGWDTAQPGFTLDESRLGRKRGKITIYRILKSARFDLWIGQVLAGFKRVKG